MIPTERRKRGGWAAVVRKSYVPDCDDVFDLQRIAHCLDFEARTFGLDYVVSCNDEGDAVYLWSPTAAQADLSAFARRVCDAEPLATPFDPSPHRPRQLCWRSVVLPHLGERLRQWRHHAIVLAAAARAGHPEWPTPAFMYAKWVWRWSTAHYLLPAGWSLDHYGWKRADQGLPDVTDTVAELQAKGDAAPGTQLDRLVCEHAGIAILLEYDNPPPDAVP